MAFGQLAPRRRSRAVTGWTPRTEVERVFDDFFRDFQDMTRGLTAWPSSSMVAGAPSIDMYEEKDKYVVKAEVPGYEKDDIHISITDNTLQLKGEMKPQEAEKEDRNYYYNERVYGNFSREIPLPSAVNQDQIRANFKNGILTIEMPKSKEAAAKEIKIESK